MSILPEPLPPPSPSPFSRARQRHPSAVAPLPLPTSAPLPLARCPPQCRPSLSPTSAAPLPLPHTRGGSEAQASLPLSLPHNQGAVPLTHSDGGGQPEERVSRIRRVRALRHDAAQRSNSSPQQKSNLTEKPI